MLLTLFSLVVAFGSALTVLTVLSNIDFMENLFFRVITGGTVGTLSNEWLSGLTPTLSFYEAALNGDFDWGGYAACVSTFVLMTIWIYNIFTYKGEAIQ